MSLFGRKKKKEPAPAPKPAAPAPKPAAPAPAPKPAAPAPAPVSAERQEALKVYRMFKDYLDGIYFRYTPLDEELVITLRANGNGLPMDVLIRVLEDRKVVQVLIPLSCKVPEDKRVDGAVAVSVANYGIINGSFDYDFNDGKILFRTTHSYRGVSMTKETIRYLVQVSCSTTDKYGDKFFALCKGLMTLEQFIEKEKE